MIEQPIVRVPRRRVPAVLLGFALVAVLALSACGGTHADPQVSTVSCSAGPSVGAPRCVFVLTDGRRFSCPQSLSAGRPTVSSLEHAKACTRLTPIRIPASWRPVFALIENVRSCLSSRGLRVLGGPVLGAPAEGPQTPLGELIVGPPPTFIAFYKNRQAAREAEPMVLQNARHLGGVVARRGAVTVIWTRPPVSARRSVVEGCAFT